MKVKGSNKMFCDQCHAEGVTYCSECDDDLCSDCDIGGIDGPICDNCKTEKDDRDDV